jgi:REP element-mobilizing transposase RayT
MRTHAKYIIAHHLIFTGYGFWLPNDLRGSGSTEIRNDLLEELGPILPGRQHIQPSREELKQFYREANLLLEFEPLWFDSAKRQATADVFAQVVRDFKYTIYACAICSNHAHLVVRRHRDDGHAIWDTFAGAARESLRRHAGVHADHPIWSDRPYDVFLYTPQDIRGRIAYVEGNPLKERLPAQNWEFVTRYDGWPHRGAKT